MILFFTNPSTLGMTPSEAIVTENPLKDYILVADYTV